MDQDFAVSAYQWLKEKWNSAINYNDSVDEEEFEEEDSIEKQLDFIRLRSEVAAADTLSASTRQWCHSVATATLPANPTVPAPKSPLPYSPTSPVAASVPSSTSHPTLSVSTGVGGSNLSGGFAQSVALARIFLKKQAQIVILDEAMGQVLTTHEEARQYTEALASSIVDGFAA